MRMRNGKYQSHLGSNISILPCVIDLEIMAARRSERNGSNAILSVLSAAAAAEGPPRRLGGNNELRAFSSKY